MANSVVLGRRGDLAAELGGAWQSSGDYSYTPPDDQDWVVLLERVGGD